MCCRGGMRAVSLALWDIRTGTGKLWPAGAALACVYAAYWAVMFFMKADAGPEDRLPVLFVASVFFAFCVPASVYGHTGFTGTCAWVDPDNHLVYIFLSNRIFPEVWNNKLSRLDIRTRIQQAVYKALK